MRRGIRRLELVTEREGRRGGEERREEEKSEEEDIEDG